MGFDQWLEPWDDETKGSIRWKNCYKIHNWIVDNTEAIDTEEGEYIITINSLKKLSKQIDATFEYHKSKRIELEDWQIDELEYTYNEIAKLLKMNNENAKFFYHTW